MNTKILLCMLVAVLMLPACAIPREDVLTCSVSDGSEFILKSRYWWNPLGKLKPHGGSGREHQEQYRVYYRQKNTFREIDAFEDVSYSGKKSNFVDVCADVGLFGNWPVVPYKYFDGKEWVRLNPGASEKLYVHPGDAHQSPYILEELMKLRADGGSAVPKMNFALFVPIGNRLVFEHPIKSNGVVVAVVKSESVDNGETWLDLTVTTDAEIFEIGKLLVDQPFAAKPKRFNGESLTD